MNSFETSNFKFFTYDFNNKLDVEFIKELIEDEDTDRYLKSIVAFINKDSFNPLKTAYLVSNNDNIVGYLNLYEENRIVELDLAVGPKHRGIKNNSNETIGCQILKEASNYLFDNYIFIRYLRGMIAKSNIKSIKTALNAGFVYYGSYSEGEEYRKYKSK